jgi:hypothetical protein
MKFDVFFSICQTEINGYLPNVGTPEDIVQQIRQRFHPEDRLMLWFDFFNHNNEEVKESMTQFMRNVCPYFD